MPDIGRAGVTLPPVCGIGLDDATRCAHYASPLDIVAIRMKCCGVYYACKECHQTLAGHATQVWPEREWEERAILCGACGTELTIRQYLDCSSACPSCGARFNPACSDHYASYFKIPCAAR